MKTLKSIIKESVLTENSSGKAESLKNLKSIDDKVKHIKQRLKRYYTPEHTNFKRLDQLYKTTQDKGKVLISKNKDLVFDFRLSGSWYKTDKASVQSLVGINKKVLRAKHKAEYETQKQKYQYGFSSDSFFAERLKEICKESGVRVYGGSNQYTTSGIYVYLILDTTELK